MTTIATDGVTIAADGLAICGHERTFRNMKKIGVVDGVIYGITGEVPVFATLIDWHRRGQSIDALPKVANPAWVFIVLDKHGLWRFTPECPYPDEYPFPAAFGSGADYAVAAMHLGKTPREAIEVAAHFDVYTGGEITEINIAEAFGMAQKEAAE